MKKRKKKLFIKYTTGEQTFVRSPRRDPKKSIHKPGCGDGGKNAAQGGEWMTSAGQKGPLGIESGKERSI